MVRSCTGKLALKSMCSCVCVSDCVDACECGFVYACCLSVYAGEYVRVSRYAFSVFACECKYLSLCT